MAANQTLPYTLRSQAGEPLMVEVSITALRLGEKWHAIGMVRDIRERLQTEHQLRLFRHLLDQTEEAIYIVDPVSSRFLDCNETACHQLGLALT